jgi:hypothetical protein
LYIIEIEGFGNIFSVWEHWPAAREAEEPFLELMNVETI